MVINPAAVQQAYQELRSRGQVPCFLVTEPESYHDSRCAFGLADDDILQIAGMMVLPRHPEFGTDLDSSFLIYSVDSELAPGWKD